MLMYHTILSIENWQCVLSDIGISVQWCGMYSWLWVSSFSST